MRSSALLLLAASFGCVRAQSSSGGDFDFLTEGLSILASFTSALGPQATSTAQTTTSGLSSVGSSSSSSISSSSPASSTAMTSSSSSIAYDSTYTPSRTFSTASSVAAAATQTSSAAASNNSGGHHSSTLAIVLGTVLGTLLLGLIILLLILCCRRRRRRQYRAGGQPGAVLRGSKSFASSLEDVVHSEKGPYSSHARVVPYPPPSDHRFANERKTFTDRGAAGPDVPAAHELSDDPFIPMAAGASSVRPRPNDVSAPPYVRSRSNSYDHHPFQQRHNRFANGPPVLARDHRGSAAVGPHMLNEPTRASHPSYQPYLPYRPPPGNQNFVVPQRPRYDAENRRRSGSLGRHSYVSHPDTEAVLPRGLGAAELVPGAGNERSGHLMHHGIPDGRRFSTPPAHSPPHDTQFMPQVDPFMYTPSTSASQRTASHSRSPVRNPFDSAGRRRSTSTSRSSPSRARHSVHDPMPSDAASIIAGATTAELQRRSLQARATNRKSRDSTRRRSGDSVRQYSGGHVAGPVIPGDLAGQEASPDASRTLPHAGHSALMGSHEDPDLDRLRRTGTLSERQPDLAPAYVSQAVSGIASGPTPGPARAPRPFSTKYDTTQAYAPPHATHDAPGFPFSPDDVGRAESSVIHDAVPAVTRQNEMDGLSSNSQAPVNHSLALHNGSVPAITTPGAFAPEVDPFASQRVGFDSSTSNDDRGRDLQPQTSTNFVARKPVPMRTLVRPLPTPLPPPTVASNTTYSNPPSTTTNMTLSSPASVVHHTHHGSVQTQVSTTWLPNGRRRTKTSTIGLPGSNMGGQQDM